MAFFMFLYMYLQILLLAYAVADGVYWNLSTTPAIFGQEITLTCHLEEISTNPTECAERKWIVDPGNKVLTNRGVSSENKKYIEDISQHNPTFDLMIMNLAESDVNVDYTCTCGFKTFSKKLVLKEERFHYPPIGTNTHFSVHNGLLKVTVHMTKVYPVPNCSLMVGDSFIQSKAVRYSQNGIVYTVDFNAEYKFREKDCNKKPIVVCTFGMVSGPVRFEGDETYKCLIKKCTAPEINKFAYTSTSTSVVPSTEVTYTCKFCCHLPAGDLGTRICQLGGTWPAPPPVCEGLFCTELCFSVTDLFVLCGKPMPEKPEGLIYGRKVTYDDLKMGKILSRGVACVWSFALLLIPFLVLLVIYQIFKCIRKEIRDKKNNKKG